MTPMESPTSIHFSLPLMGISNVYATVGSNLYTVLITPHGDQ